MIFSCSKKKNQLIECSTRIWIISWSILSNTVLRNIGIMWFRYLIYASRKHFMNHWWCLPILWLKFCKMFCRFFSVHRTQLYIFYMSFLFKVSRQKRILTQFIEIFQTLTCDWATILDNEKTISARTSGPMLAAVKTTIITTVLKTHEVDQIELINSKTIYSRDHAAPIDIIGWFSILYKSARVKRY